MPRVGVGIGRRRRVATGSGYSAEADAYFAAMAVQPDATRKGHINTLIVALKTAGVWAKLDWLSIMAAHDAQAARLNAVNPAQAMTAVNAPTFTVDRGYSGNGSSSYLDTGWNPTAAGSPKYVQNDAHAGVWVGTHVNGNYDFGLTNYNQISTDAFGSYRAYANTNSFASASNGGSAIGHTAFSRRAASGAGAYEGYRNGTGGATGTVASSAMVNAAFFVCCANSSTTGGSTPASYTTRRQQAVHWGAQLSAAEHLALYNALATYMTAVGA